MTHTPHELKDEFPAHVEKMHALKAKDAQFAKLYDAYHDINHKVHKAESNLEPTDDEHQEQMRRTRMRLKDEIWHALNKAG